MVRGVIRRWVIPNMGMYALRRHIIYSQPTGLNHYMFVDYTIEDVIALDWGDGRFLPPLVTSLENPSNPVSINLSSAMGQEKVLRRHTANPP